MPLFQVDSAKVNMVDIAQLVSASDCGSEGRGFESHYPPHKKETSLRMSLFYVADMGFENKIQMSGGHLLAASWMAATP